MLGSPDSLRGPVSLIQAFCNMPHLQTCLSVNPDWSETQLCREREGGMRAWGEKVGRQESSLKGEAWLPLLFRDKREPILPKQWT